MCQAGRVPYGGRSFAEVLAEVSASDVWATASDVWQTRAGRVVATSTGVSHRGRMRPRLDKNGLGDGTWVLHPGRPARPAPGASRGRLVPSDAQYRTLDVRRLVPVDVADGEDSLFLALQAVAGTRVKAVMNGAEILAEGEDGARAGGCHRRVG
jgi:hypothetical protein